jgi:hypothetical protein
VKGRLTLPSDLPVDFVLRSRTGVKEFSPLPSQNASRLSQIDFDAFDLVMRPKDSAPQRDPNLVQYTVTWVQETILMGKFSGLRTATVNDIAPAVFAKWTLKPPEWEFGLNDLDNDTTMLVPMDKKLAEIDFDSFQLVVGRKGQFISQELVPLASPTAVEADRSTLCTTLNSLVVTFKQMGDEKPFTLKFRKTDTVQVAKQAVAQALTLGGPEWVTLLFKGKALAEAFVLSRLRIGDTPITVHVKDRSALLLVTGKAMRGSIGEAPA